MSSINPQLRKTNSHENWNKAKLGDVVKEYKVSNKLVHHQNLLSLCYGKIVQKDIESKKGLLPASFDTYQIIKEDIIVFRVTDLQNDKKSLRVGISNQEGIITPAYVCVECDKTKISPSYLFTLLHYYDSITKVMYKMGDGLRQTLSYSDLKDLVIYIPSINEQHYITDIFRNIDFYIEKEATRLSSLKQMKVASLQALFPEEGETVPKVRFKGFEDEWSVQPLSHFANKSTEKNVAMKYNITLTNSAEYGVINQLDFFDHDISNNEHINGYFVVHNDDFVYNPRISSNAPVGPINRNQLGYSGVMSPLYLIFTVEGVNKDFLSYYFKTVLWHKFMKLEGNTGARFDRLAISDSQFFNMPIYLPKQDAEQQAIAKYFKALDLQIAFQTQRLEKLKHIKSACLDKMFV